MASGSAGSGPWVPSALQVGGWVAFETWPLCFLSKSHIIGLCAKSAVGHRWEDIATVLPWVQEHHAGTEPLVRVLGSSEVQSQMGLHVHPWWSLFLMRER